MGSLPFENEEHAMTKALDILGDDLWAVPDGEIGERSERYPLGNRAAWIQSIIDLCEADEQNWHVVRQGSRGSSGFPTGYDKEPRLKPLRPASEMHEFLDFRWVEYFKASYPAFKRLRESRKLADMKFQVGLPTGIGITFAMLSPVNALRYAGAFNRRMASEANEILSLSAPGDIVFQLEVPGELAMAYKLPKFLTDLSLRTIYGLVRQIEPRVPFGVHICFGDLNNEALVKAKTLDKMAHFANRLIAKWPETHELSYVHFPLAEAADPPPMKAPFYKALQKIDMPDNTRFVAGFVHEKRSEEEHIELLEIIENTRGHKVDIACSCGLGRRSPDIAEKLMQLSHKLTSV